MKTKFLLALLLLSISITGFCTTVTISNSGLVFTPSTITINAGDTVIFSLSSTHNASEVSQATWDADGNTALAGGFETPFSGTPEMVLPAQLGVGTHYYVCAAHASLGMKGTIIVQDLPTAIMESRLQTTISVYPNPASNLVKIKANKGILGARYSVSDQSGNQVLTGTLTDVITTLNIAPLARGVYFFQVGEKKGQMVKVIKK